MNAREREDELIGEFERLGSWEERYQKLIALGKALPPLDPELKTDDARIRGCQSQVWMHARLEDGRVHLRADSDALLVRGLVALVLRVYSGRTPAEILATPPDFIRAIGLESKLSPSRANGLVAMIKQIKLFALAFSARGDA